MIVVIDVSSPTDSFRSNEGVWIVKYAGQLHYIAFSALYWICPVEEFWIALQLNVANQKNINFFSYILTGLLD